MAGVPHIGDGPGVYTAAVEFNPYPDGTYVRAGCFNVRATEGTDYDRIHVGALTPGRLSNVAGLPGLSRVRPESQILLDRWAAFPEILGVVAFLNEETTSTAPGYFSLSPSATTTTRRSNTLHPP